MNFALEIRSCSTLETHWKYLTTDVLGAGAFGIVISVKDVIDDSKSAIKIIPIKDRDGDLEHKSLRETRILHKLSTFHHPNVVKYKSSGSFKFTPSKLCEILKWDNAIYNEKELQKSDTLELMMRQQANSLISGLYIKTEICAETLRHWLRTDHLPDPDGKDAIEISMQLIEGLCYIHDQGVIHRDFRPDNIFFKNQGFQPPVKIGDFGLSIHSPNVPDCSVTRTSHVGHHLYQAPEMTPPKKNSPAKAKYGKSVDLFSLGLTISEIFDPENNNIEDKSLKNLFNTGPKIQNNWPHVNDLITRLTSEDPIIRGTLNDQRRESWWYPQHFLAERNTVSERVAILGQSLQSMLVTPHVPRDSRSFNQRFSHPLQYSLPDNLLTQQRPTLALIEADIVRLRKLLLHERNFWNGENIQMFLDFVEPGIVHRIRADSLKKDFNSNVYRISKNRSNLLNKDNLTSAVTQMGFYGLTEGIANLTFQPA